MVFQKFKPSLAINNLVECFWVAEDACTQIRRQKIIPDGFTEIIFHYKDPYKINIKGSWQLQPKYLLAGQIRNHFFLENTGQSGMVGIKLKPTALTHLFDLNMIELTDSVEKLEYKVGNSLNEMIGMLEMTEAPDKMIARIDSWLIKFIETNPVIENSADKVVDYIIATKGIVTVKEITDKFQIGERQLERLFKKFVGLSPKLFSRIIRFNHIFQLIKSKDGSWADLAIHSGFFDQSHFIKNFQEFSGEDPSGYGFEEKNMANFFLRR